ncbi:MAG: NTP transferase domain-containing protein [Bacteroidia bacterium]|nr:NTP transferase domain-containing protein [Bacteroidia bacterium]
MVKESGKTIKRNASVIILAAGTSGRMQFPKLLLICDTGNTFIEKIINCYRQFEVEEIIVVINVDFKSQVSEQVWNKINQETRIVLNDSLHKGRLHSLILGLRALKTQSFCFVQNVDNPSVNTRLLQVLYSKRSTDHYISPVHQNKGGHPVLLNHAIIEHLLNTDCSGWMLNKILKNFEKIQVEVESPDILTNINTRRDYQLYIDQLKEKSLN